MEYTPALILPSSRQPAVQKIHQVAAFVRIDRRELAGRVREHFLEALERDEFDFGHFGRVEADQYRVDIHARDVDVVELPVDVGLAQYPLRKIREQEVDLQVRSVDAEFLPDLAPH